MAAPSAPTDIVVKPGLNPQSFRISWTEGGGDAPTSFTVFYDNATGVSDSVYKGKVTVDATRLFVEVEGIGYQKLFATALATNGDGSSAVATEASGFNLD